jgi:hypothetical protein
MGPVSTAQHPHGRLPGGGADGAALSEALDRSTRRIRAGSAPPAQTVTDSRSRLWDLISRLRDQARREILSIDDTTYLLAGGVPEPIQRRGPATLRAAIGRGVAVRQVTSRTGLLADAELGAIVYRAGGQARVLPTVPVKMSILDRQIALLPLDYAVLADGFQVIRDPSAVAALVAVHRELWNAGFDPAPEVDGRPPAHLATVLPALASGDPDDVVARRIGVSPRTYSRRVAELLSVLGARNRFQAGVEAVRRGWL